MSAVLLVTSVFLFPSGDEPLFQGRSPLAWARDLANPDPLVRSNAAAALRVIGPDAIPALTRAVGEKDSLLKKPLVSAVPRLSRKTRQWLLRTFRPFDAALDREAAVRGLMVFGTNAPVAPLARALRDPEHQIAALAAEALGQLDGAAVPALTQALHEPAPHVRSMACYGLHLVGPGASAAVPDLIERFADPETNIVAQAVAALGRVGPAAVPGLRSALKSPEGRMRCLSLRTLELVGRIPPEAQAEVIDLTRDPDPLVRQQALQTLSRVGLAAPGVVAALTLALRDPEAAIREQSVRLLGRLGPRARSATPIVRKLLQDTNADVRSNAVEALKAIDR